MGSPIWEGLPAGVQHAVEDRCGPVRVVHDVIAGSSGHFAVVVESVGGRIFCKGVHCSARLAWMAEVEARVNPYLPRVAPRLVWSTQAGAWWVNAFEHVPGRTIDLSPGSGDLPRLATALASLTVDITSWPIRIQPLHRRWVEPTWARWRHDPPADLAPWILHRLIWLAGQESLVAPLLNGSALVHTDLSPSNILVGVADHAVRVVDWSWPASGAPWIDTTMVAARLIAAGHTPAAVEAWAARVPAWDAAPPSGVNALLAYLLGMWERRQRQRPAPHRIALTAAIRHWLRHRLGEDPGA